MECVTVAKVPATSRQQFAKLYQDGDKQFWGNRPKIDTSPRPDDRFHTVVEDDRIELLAHRYLGGVNLWWVIADYNNLFFCQDLETGGKLRIPSQSVVQMEVLNG
jgi:nucleoid-associated protein YgaU